MLHLYLGYSRFSCNLSNMSYKTIISINMNNVFGTVSVILAVGKLHDMKLK